MESAPSTPVAENGRIEWGFNQFADALRSVGISGPPVTERMPGPVAYRDGRELINFAQVNFLNMQNRPDVMDHFVAASREYGLTTGGSRMSQGVTLPHIEMEAEVARVLGKPRAISFATGMLANVGFVHALSSAQMLSPEVGIDNSDVVFILDRDSHWSLWKACEKLKYGEQLFAFKHNNPAHLEKLLQENQGKRCVVIFESVYSVDGTIAPMKDIVDICERYQAISFVDDANGFCVYGPKHRPFAEEYAAMLRCTFIMVSLQKGVGVEGGAIAGPEDAILSFETLTGTSAFTGGVQPPTASTVRRVIQILHDEEPKLVDSYLERVTEFRDTLTDKGFRINEVPSYITSIVIGAEETALKLRTTLADKGFQAPVYIYPVARRNQAVVRLILNAEHTDAQVESFIDVMSDFRSRNSF